MKPSTVVQPSLPQIDPSVLDTSISIDESDGDVNVSQVIHTLQRKWFLIAGITLATTAAAAAKVFTDTPVYSDTLEILVQPLSVENEVISSTIPDTTSKTERPASSLDADLLKILASPSVLTPVVEEVKGRYPEFCRSSNSEVSPADVTDEQCYKSLVSKLLLESLESDSEILQVTLEDPDPQRVLFILKAVSDAYLKYSLSSKQADISQSIEFVDQKLPDLRKKVNSLQGQLQKLRLDNNLIDPDSRGEQLASQM
ncbi:MAG: Wzz/FepE/Etk N-terminal domain-containing protein, partial [Phormidesmis sp.]